MIKIDWFMEWGVHESSNLVKVFLYLLSKMDDGGGVYLSRREVGREVGLSVGVVGNVLRRLRSLGKIEVAGRLIQNRSKIDPKLIHLRPPISIINPNSYTTSKKGSDPKLIQNRSRIDPPKKFDPTGKKKFLDWVYLSDEQLESVKKYYKKKGLGLEEFQEAVRELDAWFANNPRMREKRLDDSKTLKGWPLDRALERQKKLKALENQQDFKFNNRR